MEYICIRIKNRLFRHKHKDIVLEKQFGHKNQCDDANATIMILIQNVSPYKLQWTCQSIFRWNRCDLHSQGLLFM